MGSLRPCPQIEYIATKLGIGECAILDPRWPKPFVVKVLSRFAHRTTLSDQDTHRLCHEANGLLLRNAMRPEVVVKPEPDTGQSADTDAFAAVIDEVALMVLVFASRWPPKRSTVTYERAGVSRAKGKKAVNKLEEVGYVRQHTFSRSGPGAGVVILEVTGNGWDELERRGLGSRPQTKTHGGWEHDLAAALVGAMGKRRGMAVRYEVSLSEHRADVEWRDKTGKRTILQIGISSPEREVKQALRIIALPGLAGNEFVLVCRDTRFRKRVESLLRKEDKTIAGRVRLKILSDYLDD